MNSIPFDNEQGPTRRAIISAMNRLFAGTPQRSNGRLNVSQLALEANVKRWYLTHQHPVLRELFQTKAAELETRRTSNAQSTDAFEELKKKDQVLQAHCRTLETRLQLYATALNLLSLENAALSGRDADAAKVRAMSRQPQHMP
ncbi:hypothetical protein GTY20_39505 [Streptomyces sp. SID4946]|uniref:hypothetical protein n=1 Tax=Streptomyces sp. LamerLS-31b TaxID=1839765 RepID=UPI00081E5782|nr:MULTISPECIES: hypothetical protein [unclassified Streptomyces]MYQ96873.1 hypothetical protein [Streptomyces sp. SID4946]SCF90820.1 hypothetical protein GA0115258_11685 [Streptomyces sp. LamerLS-31b]SCG02495.1 hypothetical protein GA0115256_14565 [Streptomyces sp. DconLS]